MVPDGMAGGGGDRLEVRYPEIRVVFADSRRLAEDWTHRFLSSALADASESHA